MLSKFLLENLGAKSFQRFKPFLPPENEDLTDDYADKQFVIPRQRLFLAFFADRKVRFCYQ